jgi:hypothetical protein
MHIRVYLPYNYLVVISKSPSCLKAPMLFTEIIALHHEIVNHFLLRIVNLCKVSYSCAECEQIDNLSQCIALN